MRYQLMWYRPKNKKYCPAEGCKPSKGYKVLLGRMKYLNSVLRKRGIPVRYFIQKVN